MFGSDGSGVSALGGIGLTVILYALLSAFGTGPLIGQRMIERADWSRRCTALVREELAASAPDPQFAPQINCDSVLGILGPQGRAICQHYGSQLRIPYLDQLQAHQQRLQDLAQRRRQVEASRALSRCDCAASEFLRAERIGLAIAAGSARIMVPPEIENLETSLVQAYRSPACGSR
ncbi:hypothetical protein LNKW23_41850 [Paralimibaculum aggregatum]|uniref:Uncharacterized protein n=1 Tax=Paralimibaculum aggregatum TaxID=3036245 RepID=A0ABQ6LQG6_9RHOB|nr:hypothetical protein [Limibaculum sp. NKW23]GMG84969.1 hypothetical protein LNKW23_41850 [Limibaculum sp. NKW23]